jgi:dimethylhistidine N-methyltransferase
MYLPEYYVTRAEHEIFQNQTNSIVEALELNTNTYFELIELGAGDGLKTKELLRFLDKENYQFDYFPIDISKNALDTLEATINNELPNVSIKKKQGDYFQVLESLKDSQHLKIVLFLGSNLGNMTDEIASKFIYELGANLSVDDKLFLGVDLIKSESIVRPAYNDSKGITKRFNLNLLKRINIELEADFDIDMFTHQPEYSEKDGIALSYLVSSIEQKVYIKKLDKYYEFKKGEKIQTEISRKYDIEIIKRIIRNTDFRIKGILTDNKKYFSNFILIRCANNK